MNGNEWMFIVLFTKWRKAMLDFKEIAQVPFKLVLTELFPDMPYTETPQGQIKGQGFVIMPSKNLFFDPNGPAKGNPLHFVAWRKNIGIRDAAQLIYDKILREVAQPHQQIP
jgi:hypothetical protein